MTPPTEPTESKCIECGHPFLVNFPESEGLDVERLATALYRAGVHIPRGTSNPAWRRKVEAIAREYAALSEASDDHS